MDDLIRRQDAVETIRKRIETLSRDEQFVKKCGHIDLYGTIPLIRSIPSAQAWIPTSERLPEERGFYLCSCTDCITILEFVMGDKRRMEEPSFVSPVIGACNSYVEAWVPLPERYREDGEQNE